MSKSYKNGVRVVRNDRYDRFTTTISCKHNGGKRCFKRSKDFAHRECVTRQCGECGMKYTLMDDHAPMYSSTTGTWYGCNHRENAFPSPTDGTSVNVAESIERIERLTKRLDEV